MGNKPCAYAAFLILFTIGIFNNVLGVIGADSVWCGTLKITRPPVDTMRDTAIYYKNGVLKKGKVRAPVAGYGITVVNDTVSLYQLPTISVLTNNHAVNYAGQTLSAVTVSWTLTGGAITSQVLTDAGSLPIGDRSHAFTGLSLTTDKTYTLTIDTGSTVVGTASTYCLFYIQKFYGTSANAAPTAGDVQAGTSQWVTQSSASRVLSSTAIAGGGNYIFYALPVSLGAVKIYANGFYEGTWTDSVKTVSITNGYGDVRNYLVYTSPNTIAGTINLEARIP